MKIGTIVYKENEVMVVSTKAGWLLVRGLNKLLEKNWPSDLLSTLQNGSFDDIQSCVEALNDVDLEKLTPYLLNESELQWAPLFRNPNKILGIGLNYQDHASDLAETSPTNSPASFIKPNTCIIGYGDDVKLPKQSMKTTGEGELGIVFKSKCKDVIKDNWLSVIAGFIAIVDMTAEDILRQNPRYLTQSKIYDTFISLGQVLVTPDEIGNVLDLEVKTVINGEVHARNFVRNMTFTPDNLVAYHTAIMTFLPGDVISTGTPGAAALSDKDTIGCGIDGFPSLINSVVDLKNV